ncbi:LysR family transcriptional regulator [Rhodococcus sp. NPDC056516]|uniref:LysR family transcriptional regulator n=1 Tax=Rhodococcus sp. NPDC056516 TaxID=3345847 RepID=UPI003670F03E
MDVRQMEYFLAVVDNGGINRAASALHVAQPSLSQSIRKLESELKTELFHRVGRGLVLAPAGEALVGPARRVLREMDAAQVAVREVRALERGRIDIAALSDMSTDPLSVWVARFRVKYPNIRMRIEERDDLAGVLELVKSGACELGVTMLPLPREEFASADAVRQRFVLVLPPGTGDDLPDPVPLEMLDRIPLVMGGRNTANRDYVERMLRESGVEPYVAVEVPQRGAVVPMVLSGGGAAILSMRVAVEAMQRGAEVKDLTPSLSRDIGFVHRVGRTTETATAFLDYSNLLVGQWDRAVDRQMALGHSRIEATSTIVAAMERRNVAAFRNESPVERVPDDLLPPDL